VKILLSHRPKKIVTCLLMLLCCPLVFSKQNPRSLPLDPRVKVVAYQPNNIVTIEGSVFINTQIIFSERESVVDVENGDSAAWTYHINPVVGNIFTLKPIVMGSNTDLSIITKDEKDKTRIYRFHLSSAGQVVTDEDKQVYSVQFIYPEQEKEILESAIGKLRHQKKSILNSVKSPNSYNWNYSFNGDSRLVPLHVFDDGKFTYLQIRHDQNIPAVFSVDNKDGKEAVVNIRRDGEYIVIQQVAPQFTLRSGSQMVASVFNNSVIDSLEV
jgi:type IV secretion system protein VirB9